MTEVPTNCINVVGWVEAGNLPEGVVAMENPVLCASASHDTPQPPCA